MPYLSPTSGDLPPYAAPAPFPLLSAEHTTPTPPHKRQGRDGNLLAFSANLVSFASSLHLEFGYYVFVSNVLVTTVLVFGGCTTSVFLSLL
jgi:hypothetical protein